MRVTSGPSPTDLFEGPGRTAELQRTMDWSATSLGAAETWPEELRAAVRTVLPSKVPMALWWGSDLIQFYNDAYAGFLGDKHPAAMGNPAEACWAEAWKTLGPLAHEVLAGGDAAFAENQLLFLTRHDYLEETYWTFSYSPIRDAAGSVVGVFVATSDVTAHIVGERRLNTVRDLGLVSTARLSSRADACFAAIDVLSRNRASVPFAAIWLIDESDQRYADLVASYGLTANSNLTQVRRVKLEETGYVGPAIETQQWQLVSGLRERAPASAFTPSSLGPLPPDAVMLVPLSVSGQPCPVGVLALGVNPYRELDDIYRAAFDLIGRQVSLLLTDASSQEAERRRSDALTELDREKTSFFQNVSHEFRTPLTLLLGPLRAVLKSSTAELDEGEREGLEAALRAGRRLQRLVDGLLDFARAEGGGLPIDLEPTDLSALTGDLVGMFRAAVEGAGLMLTVDIEKQDEPVLVDREMWARIVMNLLSNALKFTMAGEIGVRFRSAGDQIELSVSDTGIGIPTAQQYRIFDRFHRAPGSAGRGREGAGIGLAMVSHLARAHGGKVTLSSAAGSGSTFTATMPGITAADRPARPLDQPSEAATALVAEATPWIGPRDVPTESAVDRDAPRVLLVEDNQDLREYLSRLLAEDGWAVDAVSDVDGALAVKAPFNLVLSDVMLPGRDGIDLVRLIRADPGAARVPIILLTARAGAESAAEGLQAGADDYVTKPFDPLELLARVRAHFELSELREFALSHAENRAANLERALASNREIGTAIGILMARQTVTQEAAFDELRKVSQSSHRKLREVAEHVNLTGALPDDWSATADKAP